jgi:hypothetical protein
VKGFSGTGYAMHADGAMRVKHQLDIDEMTAPTNPAANTARLFVRDNGSKTELCVIFPTGSIQVIKTEA